MASRPIFFPAFQEEKGNEAWVKLETVTAVRFISLHFWFVEVNLGLILNFRAKREMFYFYGFRSKRSEVWCHCCEICLF